MKYLRFKHMTTRAWFLEECHANDVFKRKDKQFDIVYVFISKHYWHGFDYEPHEEWGLHALEQFRWLVEDFTHQDSALDQDGQRDTPTTLKIPHP